MSSISTTSFSDSSDNVGYSQAQSSSMSSQGHEEMKKKVYMRKKDRKASFAQQNACSISVDEKGKNVVKKLVNFFHFSVFFQMLFPSREQ